MQKIKEFYNEAFTKDRIIKINLWLSVTILFFVFGIGVSFAKFNERVNRIQERQDIRISNETVEKTNIMFSRFPIIETQTEKNRDEIALCRNNFENIDKKLNAIMDGLGIRYSIEK